MKGTEGAKRLLEIEEDFKVGIINTALYLNTMCKDDQFVIIIKSNEINQRNIMFIGPCIILIVE